MLDILKAEARKAVNLIEKYEFVRIFTHYDVDGITAGSIMAKSLLRFNKKFHLSFLNGLNNGINYEKDDLVILLDMGSGYPDIVSSIEADFIVIDHHFPLGKIDAQSSFVHVNPHLAGIDGSFELSASGTAYVVANQIADNKDLSGLALAGIIGDKQKIKGGNAEIVREGIQSGYIEEVKGLSLYSGKLREVLSISIEPFLDFYKKEDELEEFLEKVRIDGDREVDELDEEEVRRLANAIVLRVLENGGSEEVLNDFIGRKFMLKAELIKNATMMSDIINSCGRVSAFSIGFGICMRDSKFLDKGYEIWRKFLTELLDEIVKRKEEVKEGECMRYLVMDNAPTTGPIATVLSRYIFSDRPFIAVNIKRDVAKVSSRTTMRMSEIVDLGEIMNKAAKAVGGRGGGHRVAAGANIPPDRVEDFIKEVDRLCCSAMGK
ncbi:Single-stranded DNA-specific exonuclease [Archaeoglobus sulfaticallidus PM70-1]|uniref:Single-stranded DNA-specific exonuclease n=1 Tax=Archaeoglobus sulfaticallidus PM70-1 TaxID=387631 RepID=N0BL13_9EURY|nr:DHH family phosphoesterase [Archaeoglobus sulfaticallidus]AGK61226.1 Single-stranded DNA-specific exonuclease [Archaeoglobus sulfaticallidus PM70-1]